jgi:hypothetical protein
VAIGLARLQNPTALLANIGTDADGDAYMSAMLDAPTLNNPPAIRIENLSADMLLNIGAR